MTARRSSDAMSVPGRWSIGRRSLLRASAAVPLLAITPVSGRGFTPAKKKANEFVTTDGTTFALGDRAFYIAGANNHYLGWGSRAEVDDVLTTAKAMNLNVVRTILHSVIGSLDGTSMPSIWNWQSTADASNLGMHGTYLVYWDPAAGTWAWNDSTVNGLGRFDYVIWKAERLGLELDIALLDFWQWVGGAQQVCRWFLPDYNASNDARRYSFFYTDPRPLEFYRSWVAHVLDRTNTLTGRRYRDEPAIMAWDLMNEPEIDNTRTDSAGVPLAQSWISQMSAYVKSLDPNHLVCSGGEGFYDRDSVIDPATELAIPSIDFGTWHSYPDYHGITPAQLVELIHRHGETAAAAGKPHLLQEFSYSHVHDDQPAAFQSWTDAVYADADSAGWAFWRLVGRVASPPTVAFPAAEESPLDGWAGDNGEHFDIIDDADAANPNAWQSAQVLTAAAKKLTARNLRTKKRR